MRPFYRCPFHGGPFHHSYNNKMKEVGVLIWCQRLEFEENWQLRTEQTVNFVYIHTYWANKMSARVLVEQARCCWFKLIAFRVATTVRHAYVSRMYVCFVWSQKVCKCTARSHMYACKCCAENKSELYCRVLQMIEQTREKDGEVDKKHFTSTQYYV